MGFKQFTNVYSLSAYFVNYSPWYFLALLLTEWGFTGFPFLGYQIQNSVGTEGFTGCNTAFEEFTKDFREGKGKLHFRRKLCVVIQQDIFTSNIVKMTLEVHVLKLAMNKQRFACRFVIDFTLRGIHHDKSKHSLT